MTDRLKTSGWQTEDEIEFLKRQPSWFLQRYAETMAHRKRWDKINPKEVRNYVETRLGISILGFDKFVKTS